MNTLTLYLQDFVHLCRFSVFLFVCFVSVLLSNFMLRAPFMPQDPPSQNQTSKELPNPPVYYYLTFLCIDLCKFCEAHIVADAQAYFAVSCFQTENTLMRSESPVARGRRVNLLWSQNTDREELLWDSSIETMCMFNPIGISSQRYHSPPQDSYEKFLVSHAHYLSRVCQLWPNRNTVDGQEAVTQWKRNIVSKPWVSILSKLSRPLTAYLPQFWTFRDAKWKRRGQT